MRNAERNKVPHTWGIINKDVAHSIVYILGLSKHDRVLLRVDFNILSGQIDLENLIRAIAPHTWGVINRDVAHLLHYYLGFQNAIEHSPAESGL
jgi:hypothetical protein